MIIMVYVIYVFDFEVKIVSIPILPFKGKMQYLLTLQVNRYCLLPLLSSINILIGTPAAAQQLYQATVT